MKFLEVNNLDGSKNEEQHPTPTKLELQDVTAFSNNPTKPTNLEVTSTRLQQQNQSSNRVRFSWSRGLNGSNVKFTVHFDRGGGFKTRKNIEETVFELDNVKAGTVVKFKVRAESIDAIGSKHSAFAVSNEFLVPFTLADVPTPLP